MDVKRSQAIQTSNINSRTTRLTSQRPVGSRLPHLAGMREAGLGSVGAVHRTPVSQNRKSPTMGALSVLAEGEEPGSNLLSLLIKQLGIPSSPHSFDLGQGETGGPLSASKQTSMQDPVRVRY